MMVVTHRVSLLSSLVSNRAPVKDTLRFFPEVPV
jgi:hypothetical protein